MLQAHLNLNLFHDTTRSITGDQFHAQSLFVLRVVLCSCGYGYYNSKTTLLVVSGTVETSDRSALICYKFLTKKNWKTGVYLIVGIPNIKRYYICSTKTVGNIIGPETTFMSRTKCRNIYIYIYIKVFTKYTRYIPPILFIYFRPWPRFTGTKVL